MVLVVAFLSQSYSRLLGACTFTQSAWLPVAYVAVSFLCGRVRCGCTTCVRCRCTTCVRCGYTSGYTSAGCGSTLWGGHIVAPTSLQRRCGVDRWWGGAILSLQRRCGVGAGAVVTRLVCGVYLHDSCAMCETQVVGSGRAQVIKLGRVPHLISKNTGNSGHMTATLSYLNNQLSQYFSSITSSQAMSDFYSM